MSTTLSNTQAAGGQRSFYSEALAKAGREPANVYVDKIFPTSFRLLIWLRFTRKLAPVTFFCIYYIIWLIIRLFAILLGNFGCCDKKFASSANLRDVVLQFVISIAVSDGGIDLSGTTAPSTDRNRRRIEYTRRWRRTVWRIFWRLYAVLTYNLEEFINDYYEAWRLPRDITQDFTKEIILFIDNGSRVAIPCASAMDDKELLELIGAFYTLSRARTGLFEFFGTKSSLRVDVVTLRHSHAVGKRVGDPLDLGRYGPFSRLVHHLKEPSRMANKTELIDRLRNEGVLAQPGDQTRALNIVRSWDPYVTSTIVIVPVLFSFFLSITWALVASAYYKVDINTSTQTGFTIGSYVVTAGALLIALVAFLDSKYVANDGILLSTDKPVQSVSSSLTSLDEASLQTPQQLTPLQQQSTPLSTPAHPSTPTLTDSSRDPV